MTTVNELRIQLAAARAEEAQRQTAASEPARLIANLEAQVQQAEQIEAAQRLEVQADNARRMADDLKTAAAPVYDTLTAVHDVLKNINPDAILTGMIRGVEQYSAYVERLKNTILDEEWAAGRANLAPYEATFGKADPQFGGRAITQCDQDSKRRAQARIVALNLPTPPKVSDLLDTWVNDAATPAERQARSATLQKVLPQLFGRNSAIAPGSHIGNYPPVNHGIAPAPRGTPTAADGFWQVGD